MATVRQSLSSYAITISTFQQHRHFQREANARLFIETIFAYRDAGKFRLHAFAILPDHVHLLITPAVDQSTSRCIQLIKGGYSHAAGPQTRNIWHSSYHEHRIRDTSDFHAQWHYIANNPAKKRLSQYPFVHTAYPFCEQIDPAPAPTPSSAP